MNIQSPDMTLYGEGQGLITVKDSGNWNGSAAYTKVKEYGVGKILQVEIILIINKQFGEVQHSTNLILFYWWQNLFLII